MKLIAQKPCSFGGEKFYKGDAVPAEYVLDVNKQVKMGALVAVEDTGTGGTDGDTVVFPDPTLSIIVRTENGEKDLEPTDDGLRDIFNVLIGKAADAKSVIDQMNDMDALNLLLLSDSRKEVKKIAEARIQTLAAEALAAEEEGEQ